ncbi:MAG: prolipoprotein diacylglyceryl transferase [Maribacter sp.]|uniref:prolipoprotein diacylglyceryl transferase n=1 Tax=Maribacter sp. 2307UL18-2 TaxID=3386274 RepID=UPI0039BC8B2F
MNDNLIHWNVDPEIFWITDSFPLKYYGLFWILGLTLGYYIVQRIYKKEDVPTEQLEQLASYIFVGILLGARLGHCLFYDFEYYSEHLLEIVLPIREVNGSYQFSGFQGLASHGGVVGAIIAIAYYWKKTKTNLLWMLDRVSIGGAVTAAFIRLGNLMNSEIYGKPTDGSWGFVFERDDLIPRHPTQLYEAVAYLVIFAVLAFLYRKRTATTRNGLLVGMLFILLFSARFIIEFFKENQVGFEDTMTLNMGQWLSVPFVVFGLLLVFRKDNRVAKETLS